MGHRIRRADYPDYASYMDVICEPIGGATNPAVWEPQTREHTGCP
jgi:hypothetical protein